MPRGAVRRRTRTSAPFARSPPQLVGQRTGILERRHAPPGMATSDLAVEAEKWGGRGVDQRKRATATPTKKVAHMGNHLLRRKHASPTARWRGTRTSWTTTTRPPRTCRASGTSSSTTPAVSPGPATASTADPVDASRSTPPPPPSRSADGYRTAPAVEAGSATPRLSPRPRRHYPTGRTTRQGSPPAPGRPGRGGVVDVPGPEAGRRSGSFQRHNLCPALPSDWQRNG